MTIVRIYPRETIPAPVSVPYDSHWNGVTTQARAPILCAFETGFDYTNGNHSPSSYTKGPWLSAQWISNSDILPVGTIEGNISFSCLTSLLEFYGGGATIRLIAKVVSSNGSVVRGTLASLSSIGLDSSAVKVRYITGPVTPVEVQAGDRLVVELGFDCVSAPGTYTLPGFIFVGDGDFNYDSPAANDASFPNRRGIPWVELDVAPVVSGLEAKYWDGVSEILTAPENVTIEGWWNGSSVVL